MAEPVRPEELRVSDVERTRVEERLRRAQEVGQLDLAEFDERVRATWAARTRGELERVIADLPEPPLAGSAVAKRSRVFSDTGGGTAMRVLTIIWTCLAVVNTTAWGILALTGIVAHPWPLWLLVPGAALAVLYAFGIGRPQRD